MASRKDMAAERRARRAEARAKVTALRAQLRAALSAKKHRLRELVQTIRAERAALKERLRANRKRFLDELRSWEQGQRAEAREAWRRRREEARKGDGDLARVRGEMAAEREHAAAVRRIEREVRERESEQTRRVGSDEHVREVLPSELVPLFERVKQSIRAGSKVSRAEAFLRLAQTRPDDVFKLVEPRIEQMIRDTIVELGRARRAARSCGCVHPAPSRPANGNGLTAGGPLAAEVERIRAIESRPREAVKGEGLDTTEIAKRIREDIKAAVKAGGLPKATYSVRTDKYSMGSSIKVVASRLPFRVINAEAFRVDRGANWATFDSAHFRSRFTREAQAVERKLEAIVNAYHWDRSDSMTDYYNERFAKDVRITEDKGEWQRIEAAKVAAARAAEERSP